MRIIDLARGLKISTKELRTHLAKFGVATNAREVTQAKSSEIFKQFKEVVVAKNKSESSEVKEEEQDLLELSFEEEDSFAENKEEAESPAKSSKTESREGVPSEISKNSDQKISEITKPKTEKITDSLKHFESTKYVRSEKHQEDARLRWARAKKASEKILQKKVKKIEKAEVKRLTRKEEQLEAALQSKTQTRAAIATIKIPEVISIRDFASRMVVSPIKVVGELLKNGCMVGINENIDFETAVLIADNFHCKVERDLAAVSVQDLLQGNIEKLLADDPAKLKLRQPIIAVLGHVDHGKTTLLDVIRQTNVVAGESGGITQHIGAYEVKHKGRAITFLDTPGHEAFTTMRARGARATDIAILVVAAEEGIKPQTLEAINHAKAAEVPIIVAITKIDKPGANLEKVKGELAEHNLTPSDWGGATEVVPVSAPQKKGIEELLDLILLVNDLNPVKANPARQAVGTVIESYLDRAIGPVVTILINTGTLQVGDNFVIGEVVGRVKKIFNYKKEIIQKALPGQPVQLMGSEELPKNVGEIFQVLPSATAARCKAQEIKKLIGKDYYNKVTGFNALIKRINAGKLKELKIVVKADVEGSLEAILENLQKIGNEEVKVKVIHSGVGAVKETDATMAAAADKFLIAFNTKIPPAAKKLARQYDIVIRQHTIIYKLMEEVKKMLSGLLDPTEEEIELGEMVVQKIFFTKNAEKIIGGLVKKGKLVVGANVRVLRNDQLIGETKILNLKRLTENVNEVRSSFECGVKLNLKDVKILEGDILQAWQIEKQERKL